MFLSEGVLVFVLLYCWTLIYQNFHPVSMSYLIEFTPLLACLLFIFPSVLFGYLTYFLISCLKFYSNPWLLDYTQLFQIRMISFWLCTCLSYCLSSYVLNNWSFFCASTLLNTLGKDRPTCSGLLHYKTATFPIVQVFGLAWAWLILLFFVFSWLGVRNGFFFFRSCCGYSYSLAFPDSLECSHTKLTKFTLMFS